MTYTADERWLIADALLDEGKVPEAKVTLEQLLIDEPGHGRAHNHLGWIYLAKFRDFPKAELHLKLAMEFAPDYTPPYMHMTSLLLETRRWKEFLGHVEAAMKVDGVDRSFLYDCLGTYHEVCLGYADALVNYLKAIDETFNGPKIHELRESVKRVRGKAPRKLRRKLAMDAVRAGLL